MKLALMGLVLLILLGGGGAGAYFYFFNSPAEAALSDEAKEAEKAAAKKKEKEGGAHGKSATEFVELDPLILPIVDNDGVQQVVSIVVALEVGGPDDADKVKAIKPRLKDAYIQDLYGVLNKHAALKGGVVQVSAIKDRLNKVTHEVMGDETVHDVLLQVVQQRPL